MIDVLITWWSGRGVTHVGLTREDARALDDEDPLAMYRKYFVPAHDSTVYMDGNSLGRMPLAAPETVNAVLRRWQDDQIIAWREWIKLPIVLGDVLGSSIVDATPGDIVFGDSTSVNLYKTISAAIAARPGRGRAITSSDIFPTDRYVLESVCRERGLTLDTLSVDVVRSVTSDDLAACLDTDVAVVVLSHVAYLSGALLDMAELSRLAREVGAIVVWDVSHSAGSVRVPLRSSGADVAVGCSYKYLNGGPGAPAFTYLNPGIADELQQPIWGWFGHAQQFAMSDEYQPAFGVRQHLVGAPSILSLAAIEPGLRLLADAGIEALERKGQQLTDVLVTLAADLLEPVGFGIVTPGQAEARGSHVTLRHSRAKELVKALIRQRVIPDFRPPDMLRLGPAAIYTRFTDAWDAIDALRDASLTQRQGHVPAL